MSVKATETQIGIYNGTLYTISVRITIDGEGGSTLFYDIEPGMTDLWKRGLKQVAFLSRTSVSPKVEILLVKPGQVYNIGDD